MFSKIFKVALALAAALPAGAQNKALHPDKGVFLDTPELRVTLVGRRQNYNPSGPDRDAAICSPKSVNIHPSGEKYYVNSLEGAQTLVFDSETKEKTAVISHSIRVSHKRLWAEPSGFYRFNHDYEKPDIFTGRPVESAFSHKGRYLWIPYYRRSFDLNAQEPSALAVVDTRSDTLVRLFETGPLPKMIAASGDGALMAVTHWGDNTVGVLDISSQDPLQWHYVNNYIVDYQLKLDYSLTEKVDRDRGSGYCLRGTVFTPDNRYLLVGCMGGGGGIAVIDLQKKAYRGRLLGMMPNLRHMVIDREYLYISINRSGYVQRIPLPKLYSAIEAMTDKTASLEGWQSCKVPAGARTIALSPDGRFVYVACHFSSCLAVVDTAEMKLLGTIPADSYPVGLDVSNDGCFVYMTSQGSEGEGGNAIDIYKIEYKR